MKKLYIIEVDESEIVECWNEQATKELGYQEYALKQCPEIKVKPYNPSGDLISREALKNLTCGIIDEDGNIHQVVMLADIDNAPPVEVFTLEDMQNNYDLGAMHENGKHDRPKGEWIVTKLQHGEDVTCPFCNARPTKSEYGYYLRDNFCHECGADMRGDSE